MPAQKPLDLKAIQKLTGSALTAQKLREAGLGLVPVTPSGEIPEAVLAAFINAGQPSHDGFFQRHKLVSPETWETMRKARPAPSSFDPISGEVESDATAAAWAALAPVRVIDGTEATAADLCAYARGKGLLSSEFTSTIARRFLPRGTVAIDPPEELERAALEWPYDPDAKAMATLIRQGGGKKVTPMSAPVESSLPQPQIIINHGGVGQQINVGGGRSETFNTVGAVSKPRDVQVVDFLIARFGTDELSRLLRTLPYGAELTSHLSSANGISTATYMDQTVGVLKRRGMLDADFFTALLKARPNFHREIQILRNLYGV